MLKQNQSRKVGDEMEDNVLVHHGIKGQKWYVRRYQNKDGSLTPLGKRRALKIQDGYTKLSNGSKHKYENGDLTYKGRKKALRYKEEYAKVTVTGGKQLRKFASVKKSSETTKPKNISEMSDDEIRSKINRIKLENELRSLTPKHISTGQKFVNAVKDSAAKVARDKGTKIIGDYIEKKLKKSLGLDNNNRSESDRLRELAQDYDNRQRIDRAQRYFNEGPYARHSSENGQDAHSPNSNSSRNRGPDVSHISSTDWHNRTSINTTNGREYVDSLIRRRRRN